MSSAMQYWLVQQEFKFPQSLMSLVPFFLFLFIFLINRRRSCSNLNLPPSPPKLPIIGNLHQLGSLPHRSLHAMSQKYGPFMLLHLGQVPTLVVSSAIGAREILKTHDHIFAGRPVAKIANRLTYGKSLAFVPYGEYWREIRKIYVLQLLNSKRVKSFRGLREEETALMIETIQTAASSSFGNLVDLTEILFAYINGIICRATLGRKFDEKMENGKNLKDLLDEMMHLSSIFDVGSWIPSLSWVNYVNGVNARVEKAFREADKFLDKAVEEHIQKKKKKRIEEKSNASDAGAGADGEIVDFVDVLLEIENNSTFNHMELERDHIKALILDMFAAGTDTTHTVLIWAITELVRHPEFMREAQEEVRSISKGKLFLTEEDTEKMNYLKLVIKETLRTHPSGPLMVPHESSEAVKVQGYDIPAKATVIVNMWAIGRDPLSWEEPEKFNPNRFKDSAIDFKGHDFQYIPFGAGRRGCPGIAFAITTLELALANILNRFDWTKPPGTEGKDLDMSETSGLTVHKKENLVLAATPHYI